jgi:hypothetical protein
MILLYFGSESKLLDDKGRIDFYCDVSLYIISSLLIC